MTDLDIIQNFKIFVTPIVVVVTLLFAYIWFKNGRSFRKTKEYLNTTGKKVSFGMIMAVVVPSLVGLVLSVVAYGARADAYDEIRYLDHAIIIAGIEVPIDGNPSFVCEEKGVNNKMTSNLAIYQSLVGTRDIDLYGYYLHHSCAVNKDKPTHDAVGLAFAWRINWFK